MTRTLLIDADVVAYQSASACEVATDWGDGYYTWHCDLEEVKASVDFAIARITEELGADAVALCLTDSDENFRKTVYLSYKGNRAKVKKPLVLKAVRDWLITERGAYLRPNLEGDDVMGILSTHPKLIPGEKIIVSIDKDMKTIPGLFYRNAEDGLVSITEADADRYFLTQVLTGDTTDGYPGCPGVGPKKAEAILADLAGSEAWVAVVTAYEKAGLTEDDAIIQARCARILRSSDYNFKAKEPILWSPPSV